MLTNAQTAQLASATNGTVHIDLAKFETLTALFVKDLLGDTFRVRPIVAAPSVNAARGRLDAHRAAERALARGLARLAGNG